MKLSFLLVIVDVLKSCETSFIKFLFEIFFRIDNADGLNQFKVRHCCHLFNLSNSLFLFIRRMKGSFCALLYLISLLRRFVNFDFSYLKNL